MSPIRLSLLVCLKWTGSSVVKQILSNLGLANFVGVQRVWSTSFRAKLWKFTKKKKKKLIHNKKNPKKIRFYLQNLRCRAAIHQEYVEQKQCIVVFTIDFWVNIFAHAFKDLIAIRFEMRVHFPFVERFTDCFGFQTTC